MTALPFFQQSSPVFGHGLPPLIPHPGRASDRPLSLSVFVFPPPTTTMGGSSRPPPLRRPPPQHTYIITSAGSSPIVSSTEGIAAPLDRGRPQPAIGYHQGNRSEGIYKTFKVEPIHDSTDSTTSHLRGTERPGRRTTSSRSYQRVTFGLVTSSERRHEGWSSSRISRSDLG